MTVGYCVPSDLDTIRRRRIINELRILANILQHTMPCRGGDDLLGPPGKTILFPGPLRLLKYFMVLAEGDLGVSAALGHEKPIPVCHPWSEEEH